ncbi:MAG TPA: YXWGXW repeat-containing protein [Spirochaetia bacterium]|nr:YXWGXW repeat-containing protein [Spirochaetia bacterium]
MKISRLMWVVLLAAASVTAAFAQAGQAAGGETGVSSTNLSPGVADVIKLANAGVGDDVIIAYIAKSQQAFALTTDDIIALNNSKVSAQVITAILSHEGLIENPRGETAGSQPQATGVAPAPVPAETGTTIIETTTPAPMVEVVPLPPGPGFMWAPGHWYWNNGWVWMSGSWTLHRPWPVYRSLPHPIIIDRAPPPRPIIIHRDDNRWRRW